MVPANLLVSAIFVLFRTAVTGDANVFSCAAREFASCSDVLCLRRYCNL